MMKTSTLMIIGLLAGTLAVIGCTDDPPADGPGGTGGTGIDVCTRGVCADDPTKEDRCQTFLTACAAGEVPGEDCAAGGLLICHDFDGAGGAGGGGGTGGAGGAPDPDVLCTGGVCATDADKEQLCKDAIALCLANNPGANEEECIQGLSAIICLDAVCTRGVCADDPTKEDRCRTFLAACAAGEEPAEDCAAGGLLICHDFDGAGGTGGGGGTGGAGGAPDPDVLCTVGVCATDADKEQLCKDAIDLCLANNPGANEEECVLGLSLIICKPL